MAENSNIEWTDHTFNPWIGCQKVSDGCKYCYAERDFTRKPRWANTWGPPETSQRLRTSEANWRKPLQWQRQAEQEGARYKVFCASLADVFEDNDILIDWRLDLWTIIKKTPDLDWLLLTKRPDNVIKMTQFNFPQGALPFNVWIGASIENQSAAHERLPHLLKIPAIVRFLSIEPLLGPINLGYARSFDWIIVGGESGPGARPMDPRWVRNLRGESLAGGVPFFFKQWGGVNKKAAGRLLDGREWNEFPQLDMA